MLTFISFDRICKSYGPVRVLRDVSIDIGVGTIHALIGENGAGKSTLMKILCGYLRPDVGELRLEGKLVNFKTSREAESASIVLIHQEFNLSEDLSVAANMYLGMELQRGLLLDDTAMIAGARTALERIGSSIDPRRKVRELIVPERQIVEIAKALLREVRVLVMDEPTATLTPTETAQLFRLMRDLQTQGVTILYVSHKLDEVKFVTDRVTVLRDGAVITTKDTNQLTTQAMANLMVGRELEDMFPPKNTAKATEVVLELRDFSVPNWASHVNLTLRRGEVLGMAGLIGSGRTELMEGVFGLRAHSSGAVLRRGQPLRILGAGDAVKAGMAYLSEDRKGKGLHVDFALRPNVTLMTLKSYAKPLLDLKAEQRTLQAAVLEYGIRTGRLDIPASALSGGNQQKLALAKIMQTAPDVIVLDEPTRGVDVGAKREIYFLIAALAQAGKSVIVISSELPELLGLSHRILVMRGGRIAGSLTGEDMTETAAIQLATGVQTQSLEESHAAA